LVPCFCFVVFLLPLFLPLPQAIGQEVKSPLLFTFASRLPTRAGLVLFFVFIKQKQEQKLLQGKQKQYKKQGLEE
jgi:hypothetical protein